MECEAWESRLVMHTYSFLYVMLLSLTIPALMLRRTADAVTGERRDRQAEVDRLSRRRDELEQRTAALAEELRGKRERVQQLERGDGDARLEARAAAAEAERELQEAARATVEAALARARESGVDPELLLQAVQARATPVQRLPQLGGTATGPAAAAREGR